MFGMLGYEPTLIVSYSLTLMMINLTPTIPGLISWMRNPLVDLDSDDFINNLSSNSEIGNQ
jgi:hypothetical protein